MVHAMIRIEPCYQHEHHFVHGQMSCPWTVVGGDGDEVRDQEEEGGEDFDLGLV